MKTIGQDDMILLLGAGASVEAGIPHSKRMIEEIEARFIDNDSNWSKYRALYNYVQSAIYYSEGIRGKFSTNITYNIERLIDTLNEVVGIDQHVLYPFVESWSPRLMKLAGDDYALAKEFRDKIVNILLSDWLAVRDYASAAGYYSGILDFRDSLEVPLRVFTLNYDLCLERACNARNLRLQRGFGDQRFWNWREFEEREHSPDDIYLYKLHGSVDWTREDGKLTYFDDISAIVDPAIIFGSSYKLEYEDPFLFSIYEFRRWSLEAKILLAIGYGFGDEHINKILQQALGSDDDRQIIVVGPCQRGMDSEKRMISNAIGHCDMDRIHVCDLPASEFMTKKLSLDFVSRFVSSGASTVPF